MVVAQIEELVGIERARRRAPPGGRRAARTAGCTDPSRATSARRARGCSSRRAHRCRRGARQSSPSGCGATASRPSTGPWSRWCRTATPASADRGAVAATACGQPLSYDRVPTVSIGTVVTASSSRAILGEANTRDDAGIVEDLLHLPGMELVVDRDDHALRRPDGEHELDDLRAILAGDRDPCARPACWRMDVASRNARSRNSPPGAELALAEIHGAAVTEARRGLVQQREQVQRGPIPTSTRSPTGTWSNSSRRRPRSSAR